ncbi:MAG: MBOAT family protein [Clostridiales bacterium]|nr:MBOAT family protein [Clostridiales bacterium]
MVFASVDFLIWFLPFFLATYYVAPVKIKNFVIVLFSLVFYGYGCVLNPEYLLLLVISVIVNWLLGFLTGIKKGKKLFLFLGIVFNFGLLILFKYLSSLLDFSGFVMNRFGINPPGWLFTSPLRSLVLPLGISFVTFQSVSYLTDICRGDITPEKNPVDFAVYMIAFPQIITGPIVRYDEVSFRIHNRYLTKDFIYDGAEKFVFGLGMKVLIADRVGGIWNECAKIGYEDLSAPMAWLGIAAYSLKLYFDFYGYSLMAVGLGKLIGFDYPDNFREPYTAVSMTEFWRRWHMTLGSWFRDYVYIPLGGNRKGKARMLLNLVIVWTFTGIWHGAGANFVLWGLCLAVIIIIEKLFLKKILDKHRFFGHIYMIVLIPLSWLVFALDSLTDIKNYFMCMIGMGSEYVYSLDWLKCVKSYGIFVIAGVIFSTKIGREIFKKIRRKAVVVPVMLAVLAASGYCVYKGMNDPFMYFNF